MSRSRTFGFHALVALLLVALTIPGEAFRPDVGLPRKSLTRTNEARGNRRLNSRWTCITMPLVSDLAR